MTGVAWLYTRGSERQVTLKPNAALRRAGFKQTTLCDASALSSQSLSLSEADAEITLTESLLADERKMRFAAEAERDRLKAALEPFVRLANSYFYRYETRPGEWRESHENDPDERAVYGINRVEITTGDFRRARKALENGPAGLADATNDPADPSLSSLRKGAEDIEALVTQVEDVVLADWFRHTSDPEASRRVVVRAVVKRTLAALVSGSREDGADA